MIETEPSFDNNNICDNENFTEVSCTTTTTTLIKCRVSNKNCNNNEYLEEDESLKDGNGSSAKKDTIANSSAVTSSTASPSAITSTTKATTTFSFNSQNHSQSDNSTNSRPPFITTVTRGKFLKSKFDLMVERSLFTFSSRPRPVNLVKHHCCSFTNTTAASPIPAMASYSTTPRGAHDYYNVMWDPHIVRGSTASTTTRINERHNIKEQSKSAENNVESKTTKKRFTTTSKVNSKPRHHINSKGSSLLLSHSPVPPPPVKDRLHTMIQTEQYLEELLPDINGIGHIHQSVQTEPTFDLPFLNGVNNNNQPFVQVKSGVDISTQILSGELFFFDEEVQPILESLIGKILEQAMFETIEEEEISALREEKNRFHEQRRREERELRDLKIEHERMNAEKEQLKRHLEDEHYMSHNDLMSSNDYKFNAIRESESKRVTAGTSVYTTSYLLELLPSVINSLRQEGFLTDNTEEDTFAPYAHPHKRLDSFSSTCSTFSRKDNGEESTNFSNDPSFNPNEEVHAESVELKHDETIEIPELGSSFVEEITDEQNEKDSEGTDTKSHEMSTSEKMNSYNNTSKDLEEFSTSVSPSQLESSSHDTTLSSTSTALTALLQEQQLSNDD